MVNLSLSTGLLSLFLAPILLYALAMLMTQVRQLPLEGRNRWLWLTINVVALTVTLTVLSVLTLFWHLNSPVGVVLFLLSISVQSGWLVLLLGLVLYLVINYVLQGNRRVYERRLVVNLCTSVLAWSLLLLTLTIVPFWLFLGLAVAMGLLVGQVTSRWFHH